MRIVLKIKALNDTLLTVKYSYYIYSFVPKKLTLKR